MHAPRPLPVLAPVLVVLALVVPDPSDAGRRRGGGTPSHEPAGHQTYASPQSNPIAVSPDGSLVAVAATTSNRVDVIDTATNTLLGAVFVGMEPVGVAFRPDGSELWAANHLSDSVSVIDTAPASASFLQVVETVQDLDPATGVTLFDEPVGIAFESDGSRAFVTLSSRNELAVIDATTYQVTSRLHIRAQDPRAIATRKLGPEPTDPELLFVAAFESSNQSELSACEFTSQGNPAPADCTLDRFHIGRFVQEPQLAGYVKNIHLDPDLPDRDLFVFDLSSDPPTELPAVSGVGTLLYGLAVDGAGRVFVTQADARNAENGIAAGAFEQDVNDDGVVSLADLENRMFLNRIAVVDCAGASCGAPGQFELDAPVGQVPAPGTQLATPFGIAVSDDDALLVVSAAASSRIASVRAADGVVLDRLDVGEIPRGVALRSEGEAPGIHTAWVLNTLGNSLWRVSVDATSGALGFVASLTVGEDPTPQDVRLGRIAFNDADASDSGTFSCASCHPDGHVDQLLWRIGGACEMTGCVPGEDEPRTTMPVRGLRDTLPLHWDGSLGKPFDGWSGVKGVGFISFKDCDLDAAGGGHDCFVDLAEESLAGVMCDQDGNPQGCPPGGTQLSSQEISDMARFLESVSYPPARSRPPSDVVSATALDGFRNFFTNQGNAVGLFPAGGTCADSTAGCHELPLGAATESVSLQAFEAPTMRGMTDRFVHFSLGLTSPEEILKASDTGMTVELPGTPIPVTGPANPFPWNDGAGGYEEATTFAVAFAVFNPLYSDRGNGNHTFLLEIFQMLEEASTGHSGALGRQVTLNSVTTAGCPGCPLESLLAELETADARQVVNLRGNGLRNGSPVTISYLSGNKYLVEDEQLTRDQLIAEAQGPAPALLATLTAHLAKNIGEDTPQPLVAPPGASCDTGAGPTGDPALPQGTSFALEAKYVSSQSRVFVDGVRLPSASIVLTGGTPVCGPVRSITPRPIQVDLGTSLSDGLHLLQIQTRFGLLSNELPICVGPPEGCK